MVTIQVAADEDPGIAALLVAAGPFLFGIEKRMHALETKAPMLPFDAQNAFHASALLRVPSLASLKLSLIPAFAALRR